MERTDFPVCPLLSIGRASDPVHCLQDGCAWWHVYEKQNKNLCKAPGCALLSAANALTDIDMIGIEIND